MLAAPLIAGNDVRHMSEATRHTLTNKDVIAVDQDPLGVQGLPYKKEDGVEFWFKPLAHDAWAVAVLNRNRDPRSVRFDWATEHVEDGLSKRHLEAAPHVYALRNLLAGTPAGTTAQPLQVTVPGHDVAMFRLDSQP
ncbi:MAG TPA: glycoside hydrolase family 27 protein, partial [Vicinamibacteria bacterium]|nr:glycoside hydrolase family 27 protein [Vicinamibacteria bacterium]